MSNYSHILWDFNGTILDDTEAGIKSENVLLTRRNMPLIESVNAYREVFTFPIIEYYKKLGHNFEDESYDDLAVEWMEQYLIHSKFSKLQYGVKELLEHIKSKNIPQLVLSASEVNLLKGQLKDFSIDHYFTEILGLNNILAHSKIDIGKEWVNRVKPTKAVLIGDTVHDFQVANAIGIDCILICAGHQNRETLLECKVPVLENLTEAIRLI